MSSIHFKNPVGLSAGADKNCEAPELFLALGFGFLESVSFAYQAQEGNPRPRMFRLAEDDALINRLGFPSDGAEALAQKVAKAAAYARSRGRVFAVNFAKSKSVPLEDALEDYLRSFRIMKSLVDYITINVSSPNTPGLRALQARSHLAEILEGVQKENTEKLPLLVKIAPDLELAQLDEIIQTCIDARVQGIVATNSTISRDAICSPLQGETGGLSGRPLFGRSLPIVKHIYRQAGGKLKVVGVGGIFSAADAIAMFRAGASLIEIYTALVYEGPGLVRTIKQGILTHLDKVGAKNISEIIGVDN